MSNAKRRGKAEASRPLLPRRTTRARVIDAQIRSADGITSYALSIILSIVISQYMAAEVSNDGARSGSSPYSHTDEPPPPPNPASDPGVLPRIATPDASAPTPPAESEWDAGTIAPETALKILCRCLESLANATGDIPPTPPVSRPTTPKSTAAGQENRPRSRSRPATPTPDVHPGELSESSIPGPEACASEPVLTVSDESSEPVHVQHEIIARKFFSKKPPPISLENYLLRLQRFCPMSTAVYLAAGTYIHRLAVVDKSVPVTSRTIHRLVLASLRVAMKALEDLRYSQKRFAGVGGVEDSELGKLEISLCYLTDFDLQVNNEMLYERISALQRAAQRAAAFRGTLRPMVQPTLPLRRKANGC